MESFFYYYMALQSTATFPIPSQPLLYICATFSGGTRLLGKQTGFITLSPRLLKDNFIRSLHVWKSAYAPHNM